MHNRQTFIRAGSHNDDPGLRRQYNSFVQKTFTGKGYGLPQIVLRLANSKARPALKKWLADQDFRGTPLPRDLSAKQWAELFAIADGEI